MVFIALMVFVGFRVARDCPEKPDPLKHQEYRFRLSPPPCLPVLISSPSQSALDAFLPTLRHLCKLFPGGSAGLFLPPPLRSASLSLGL
jgi:hypothetical protein